MEDLDKRLELLRQAMAEPLDVPLVTPQTWLEYLKRKLEERRCQRTP
jgi:molybdopterin-biosynthesis enzyme MoeA-like protein